MVTVGNAGLKVKTGTALQRLLLEETTEGGRVGTWRQRHSAKHFAELSCPLLKDGKAGSDRGIRVAEQVQRDE